MQLGFIGTGEITSSIVTDRRGRGGSELAAMIKVHSSELPAASTK